MNLKLNNGMKMMHTETINGVDYDVSASFTVTVVAKDANTPALASAEVTSDYSILRISHESVAYALASLSEPTYVEPEATEPEATEPEATEPEATEPEA